MEIEPTKIRISLSLRLKSAEIAPCANRSVLLRVEVNNLLIMALDNFGIKPAPYFNKAVAGGRQSKGSFSFLFTVQTTEAS